MLRIWFSKGTMGLLLGPDLCVVNSRIGECHILVCPLSSCSPSLYHVAIPLNFSHIAWQQELFHIPPSAFHVFAAGPTVQGGIEVCSYAVYFI